MRRGEIRVRLHLFLLLGSSAKVRRKGEEDDVRRGQQEDRQLGGWQSRAELDRRYDFSSSSLYLFILSFYWFEGGDSSTGVTTGVGLESREKVDNGEADYWEETCQWRVSVERKIEPGPLIFFIVFLHPLERDWGDRERGTIDMARWRLLVEEEDWKESWSRFTVLLDPSSRTDAKRPATEISNELKSKNQPPPLSCKIG